ncbi:cold shock domain-containing protein [Fulvimonas sp. R45]|uniref:cold shock domain-containing protein n=1 Tax=Fulvimonas sp. R45 TaxID=3045937 RepID=UPI00265DDF26|nr:cold shock domain-containing protein [Fulvimonas sp. R45]MDO1529001.1 cold shock domain-containing protein [Fulvimonas sp. R45]
MPATPSPTTRTHGTLTAWNDERGFGFITPVQGLEKVFVHVSAFPRDGRRPSVGEPVSFEIDTDAQGRKRALSITRPGRHPPPRGRPRTRDRQPRRKHDTVSLTGTFGLLLAIALGGYGYNRFGQYKPPASSPTNSTHATASLPDFSCDGRTRCSQMHSCAEAKYFLKYCPGAQMDGDGDGEPCEQQWCGAPDGNDPFH